MLMVMDIQISEINRLGFKTKSKNEFGKNNLY